MDVLKELQSAVTDTYERSFERAFRTLESRLAAHEVELTEAKNHAFIANEARQIAECRCLALQQEATALQEELSHYASKPTDLEPTLKWEDIEHEFAPEHVWRTHRSDTGRRMPSLESKYKALYNNFQTYGQTWMDLKAKVLQHKKKLRHIQRQLRRDEFIHILDDGTPVTYQRVPRMNAAHASKSAEPPVSLLRNLPQVSRISRSAIESADSTSPDQNLICSAAASPPIKSEPNSQNLGSIHHAELNSAKSPPRRDSETSESASDMVPPLPDLHTRKRKRDPVTGQLQRASCIIDRPVHVKNEPTSSSPSHNSAYALGQLIPSTQDLDDMGSAVQTPTKRHMQRTVRWHDSVPLDFNDLSGPSTVLQPVDGNSRNTKSLDQRPGYKKAKFTDPRAILSISEDGDTGDSSAPSHHAGTPSMPSPELPQMETHFKGTQGRLEGLLEKPLRSRTPLMPFNGKANTGTTKEPRGITPEGENRPTNASSFQQQPQLPQNSISQVEQNINPEDEPYRSRPLHRLTLNHFKINPHNNQGLDYAYTAVVRKKDDRKCLSGCTRPECCGGKFRAMARLGGLPAKSPGEQKEEDQRVLEEYVGDDLILLNGLSSEERENLLIEARTRAMANQYGKHRHNHQRARSPPGFWRTDMPSTQEIESDRETAQRLERDKVEERYREAMRPGGLWTWADE
ncbi:DNA repair protein Sae2/CtIP [Penicillium angulare]|uniref:DNA repair protein Sae2/CtIP n=1 Tax=Penicillium angulare TaxID=116970 RepID=UPI002540CFF8|nr:DNA repair protein Sae2/CtIP [Penicillium angulare]KAJ5272859.1 DNA repair protein Sae2/CtIP [Penicillium angulare]